MKNYLLLYSGKGEKLERFGPYLVSRPASFAIWPKTDPALWQRVDAHFDRKKGWAFSKALESRFILDLDDITLELFFSKFGHIGLFPEHLECLRQRVAALPTSGQALNLFGYTGALSIQLAKLGYKVFHVDASKIANESARKNMELNEVAIHLFQDDVLKFCKRQLRRGAKFDCIVIDPPTHGRGPQAEVFKIEKNLNELISLSSALLSERGSLLLTCHSPGFSDMSLATLLGAHLAAGRLEKGALFLKPPKGPCLPAGFYATWQKR